MRLRAAALTIICCVAAVAVCQPRAVVGEAKGNNQQGQAQNQVTVAQTPTPPVQAVVEQPKTADTGQRANDKTQITIDDARSNAPQWAAIILNFLLLLVVGYQAYTYKQQLQIMREERGVISEQAGTLKEQAEAMKGQLDAMQDSLTETRKLVEHNERVVKASETQASAAQAMVENAKQTFSIGERAYL